MSITGLRTADDVEVVLCTDGGLVDHDWRPKTYRQWNGEHTSLVCVWCQAVCCGGATEPDPCIEPYHHGGEHRSRSGMRWPKG
jgi:hypothetical protein